jgi:hypothetical protein
MGAITGGVAEAYYKETPKIYKGRSTHKTT